MPGSSGAAGGARPGAAAVGGARIAVDIGGTFTDLVLLTSDGTGHSLKVSSTPERPEEAVIAGIVRVLAESSVAPSAIAAVLHGTTVGSNALLQKTGARCGLITTRGFRDVLEIGRARTPTMFDLTWEKPPPLVRRRHRVEVVERVSAAGEVLRAVEIGEVLAAGRFFRAEGIQSVAICFINSYANPVNEFAAAAALREAFPDLPVSESVAVLPEMREYERTSTVAVNAYVLPVLRDYLERLARALRDLGIAGPLLIGNSNGGLSTAAVARAKPVFFVSSGRSAGAVGASRLGEAVGEKRLVVFDMGGTTASAVLIDDGRLSRSNEYEFRAGISTPSRFIKAGGYMMRVPTVDVAEVGSGAGSIASIDEGGLLSVGPLSAGARPGPACYGTGGIEPTVTDANVVLGFLPAALAGGTLALDVEKARSAIARHLADPLGLSVEAAACGVRDVVNSNMARAIRAVTVERGVDPRDFTLLAFGGSGPVHACDLARTLGMTRILFPPAPGVFTAMGMLAGNVEHHVLRPFAGLLDRIELMPLRATMAAMRVEAFAALADEGFAAERVTMAFSVDLRFRGQDSEIGVPVADEPGIDEGQALRRAFLDAYRAVFGYVSSDAVEMVSVRLRAEGIGDRLIDFRALKTAPERDGGRRGTRRIYFDRDRGWVETQVVARDRFVGSREGPVVIESDDTTVVIPPDAVVSLDQFGNLAAALSGRPR
jgi:N-methylhydantoinase A